MGQKASRPVSKVSKLGLAIGSKEEVPGAAYHNCYCYCYSHHQGSHSAATGGCSVVYFASRPGFVGSILEDCIVADLIKIRDSHLGLPVVLSA